MKIKIEDILKALEEVKDQEFDTDDKLPEPLQKILDTGFGKASEKTDGLKAEVAKLQSEAKEMLKKLTDKDGKIKATDKELQDYRDKLEEIENAGQSEVDRLKGDLAKSTKKHESELAEAKKLADSHQKKYFDTVIRQVLHEAAVAGEAYDPNQVLMMLSSQMAMVEKGEGDNLEYVPTLTLTGMGEEKDKTLEFTDIKKGVKEFLGAHANLLRSKIIRDDDKNIEALTIKDEHGNVKSVNLDDMSAEEINKDFEKIHQTMHPDS